MKLKRLIAGVLSAAMMLSVGSTLAFAEEGDSDVTSNPIVLTNEEMTFKSIIYLSEHAITAPSVTYNYTLTAGEKTTFTSSGTDYDVAAGDMTTTAATDDAEAVIAENLETSATFTTADYAVDYMVIKDVAFDFEGFDYTVAGYYHYVISEATPDGIAAYQTAYAEYETAQAAVEAANPTDSGYEDLATEAEAKDAAADALAYQTRNVIVQVTDTSTDMDVQALTVTKVLMFTNDDYTKKSDSFINRYGLLDNHDAGAESTNFIITDRAFGDTATYTKDFSFATVTADVADGTVFKVTTADGETQYIIQTTADGLCYAKLNDLVYESNNIPVTFNLHNGEEFIIHAIGEGMTFKVTISDDENDGYRFYARGYAATDAFATTSAYEESTMNNSYFDTDEGVKTWLTANGFVEGTADNFTEDSDKLLWLNGGATADYYIATESKLGDETKFYVVLGSNLAHWLEQAGVINENDSIYNGSTYAEFCVILGKDSSNPNELDGLVSTVEFNGQDTTNLLDYLQYGYELAGYGGYCEAYQHAWNDLSKNNLNNSYTVTIESLLQIQIGDNADPHNSIPADFGIDFATVKGQEKLGEDGEPAEEDDYLIVYSAAMPDTGVVLDLAPYAIMMVLAFGFITFRFVNVARKTEE